MTSKAIYNQQRISDIKRKLNSGQLDYDSAKLLAEPIIAQINIEAERIAKKHNKRPAKFSFAELMR